LCCLWFLCCFCRVGCGPGVVFVKFVVLAAIVTPVVLVNTIVRIFVSTEEG
jgi:hypothetical protein